MIIAERVERRTPPEERLAQASGQLFLLTKPPLLAGDCIPPRAMRLPGHGHADVRRYDTSKADSLTHARRRRGQAYEEAPTSRKTRVLLMRSDSAFPRHAFG